jgi:hypothetical protein
MSVMSIAETFLRNAMSAEDRSALAAFRNDLRDRYGKRDPAVLFHAVRKMPYLSSGDRSLAGILRRKAGSCSAKHILLAALLQDYGVEAEVLLVKGDFAAPLREATGVPGYVSEAAVGGIPDIHNIVRARIGGCAIHLDATWHDAMRRHNFRVNDHWNGAGDTRIALDVEEWLGTAEDIAARKAEIISQWPAEQQAKRRRFLEAINQWVETIGR